ncbi:MAG: hypothetical protein BRD48_06040 [Bacteroidetes bacterium QS_9_68_14]|nr:MAG: hypothetical protein BRD48_06040 [Bacteroidetes bacterium QS_9_68_14]
MGTVRLVNAVFYAHHGVMEEEHRIGGRYEVDVAARLDFYLTARRVAEAFPHVETVEVTVRKPNPPVGGTCDRAEAVYRFSRDGEPETTAGGGG